MTDQNIKNNQQKELYLRCIKTDNKTRNYIFFFFAARQKPRKFEQTKTTELIIDFGGQNDTEHNSISIILP